MIRSTKVTLKYANTIKSNKLDLIVDEYQKVTQFFVDYLWNNFKQQEKIPCLLPKEITSLAQTWLTARMIQCCAKQASGIVRGTRAKHEKRLYVHNKLIKEGKNKQAKKLAHVIKTKPIGKPKLESIEMELDSRFIKIDWNNHTTFDGWITISSIGNKLQLELPFKSHKKLNELLRTGKQTGSVRISKKSASFSFELPEIPKNEGKIVGIDIGMNTAFSCSDGNCYNKKLNGHNIESACKIVARKQKGSNGFKRACQHRKNLIGYYKNQINWQEIKEIRIENIKNLRYKKRTSRYMNSFVYRTFFESLRQMSEKLGVQVTEVCPTYTSQRCSSCGWTRKRNRKGKQFKCSNCSYTIDADLNASINISLGLKAISKKERCNRINMSGFFWHVDPVAVRSL